MTYSKAFLKAKGMTPKKQAFVNAMLTTDNATQAVRIAYPELAEREQQRKAEGRDYPFLKVKANRLITNDYINNQLLEQRQRLTLLATKGIRRLDSIITDGKEHNALAASMYVVDQSIGKATQQIETSSRAVTLNIDLTSSISEPTTEVDEQVEHQGA